MDFVDERDYGMERDIYEIEIGERIVHIPFEVIEERMRLMYIDSIEEAIEDAKDTMEAFASSLSNEEIKSANFEKRALKFLDCETNVYRRIRCEHK